MKSKFEVGDKINVYDSVLNRKDETIGMIDADGLIYINPISQNHNGFEPEQCRKLVKKKGVRVTREMLAKAWDTYVFTGKSMFIKKSIGSDTFKTFCKELGLD